MQLSSCRSDCIIKVVVSDTAFLEVANGHFCLVIEPFAWMVYLRRSSGGLWVPPAKTVVSRLFPNTRFLDWLGDTCGCFRNLPSFFALGPFIAITLVILGVFGFALNGRLLLCALQSCLFKRRWLLTCYSVVAVVLAIRASGRCEHYDTGLYGASAVRWAIAYPTVPGLANLHGRFGYHSAVYLCTAALHQGLLSILSYRLLEGLLILVMFITVVEAAARLLRGGSGLTADWFLVLLLIPVTFWIGRAEIVGTNTDLPATIITLLAVYYLFAALGRSPEPFPVERTCERLFAAISLFSLAVAVKLSVIALCGLGWIIAFIGLQRLDLPQRKKRQVALAGVFLSACILVPWLISGILISGYAFYPSSVLGLSVDWRVPPESLALVKLGLRSWARIPHGTLSETAGTLWFGSWFDGISHNREGFLIPAVIVCIGAAVVLIHLARDRSQVVLKQMFVLIPSIIGLAFWFSNAPALRFGESAIWSTAAALGAISLSMTTRRLKIAWTRMAILVVLAVSAWCLYPRNLWRTSFEPPLKNTQFAPLPNVETTVRQTLSGLEVRVPAEGNQCWEAPLPCTAYFNETLRQRRPGHLGAGFYSAVLPNNAEWLGKK